MSGSVGSPAQRVGGLARVTGAQQYLGDIRLPGALHVKLVTLDCARARILSVDASEAERLPGVRLVMTAADLPQPVPRFGPQFHDRPILAVGETKYHGEPVAAVAADTLDAAEEGARRVRVDYEELPAVYTIAGGALTRRARWCRILRCARMTRWPGPTCCASITSAGARSRTRPATWSSRGPTPSRWSPTSRSSPTASWPRPMAMGSSSGARSSIPSGCRGSLPNCLACRLPRSGSSRPIPAAASAESRTPSTSRWSRSWRCARAARSGSSSPWRRPSRQRGATAAEVRVRTGFRTDGTITFREVEANYLLGAYADIADRTVSKGSYSSCGPYRIPAARIVARSILSHTPPSTAFRGFGTPQPQLGGGIQHG